ncbi:MAG: hypothetical protein AB7V58_04060 [Solirubrobacterales bacterium]
MATMLLARYEVADRARFLEEFDAFEAERARAGGVTRSLLVSVGEGVAFVALVEFATRAEAEGFAGGPQRRAALDRATVTGHTDELLEVMRP